MLSSPLHFGSCLAVHFTPVAARSGCNISKLHLIVDVQRTDGRRRRRKVWRCRLQSLIVDILMSKCSFPFRLHPILGCSMLTSLVCLHLHPCTTCSLWPHRPRMHLGCLSKHAVACHCKRLKSRACL
jgi:hypothetical protein